MMARRLSRLLENVKFKYKSTKEMPSGVLTTFSIKIIFVPENAIKIKTYFYFIKPLYHMSCQKRVK